MFLRLILTREAEELTTEDLILRNPNPDEEHLTVETVDPGSLEEQTVLNMIASVDAVMTTQEAENKAVELEITPYVFIEPNVTETSFVDGETTSTMATSEIPTEVWDSGPMAVDYSPDDTTDTPWGRGGPVWLTVDQLPDVQGRMGYFRLTEMECVSLGKKLSFHLRGHAKEKGFKTVEFGEEQSADIGDLLKVIGKQWSRLTVMTIIDLLTSRHCDKARFELQAEALDEDTRLGRGTNWHFTRIRASQGHNACLLVLDSDPRKTTVAQWALDDNWEPSYTTYPLTGPFPYRATSFDLMPKIAYHASYWRNFNKIASSGLIPGGKMTLKRQQWSPLRHDGDGTPVGEGKQPGCAPGCANRIRCGSPACCMRRLQILRHQGRSHPDARLDQQPSHHVCLRSLHSGNDLGESCIRTSAEALG